MVLSGRPHSRSSILVFVCTSIYFLTTTCVIGHFLQTFHAILISSQLLVSYGYFPSFSRLDAVMCMGVTAGAYILTLFAVCVYVRMQHAYRFRTATHLRLCFDSSSTCSQTKYRERVIGLILVSPLCKAPSWTEWLYNKVCFRTMPIVSL